VIWVGTLGGLNSLDPKSGTFRAYDVTNGLAGNFVSCILNDTAGFLWMSTNRARSARILLICLCALSIIDISIGPVPFHNLVRRVFD
jgi:hypothetical protein